MDHEYATALTWTGSTANGYRDYPRDHQVAAAPAEATLRLSADPHFRGSQDRLNPEQLLVAAVSSCQLLSFLAEAAIAGVDVVGYEDAATGLMPGDPKPMRVTEITLRPRITVAAGTDEERVLELVEAGHRGCFVGNSLSTTIHIEPTIMVAGVFAD